MDYSCISYSGIMCIKSYDVISLNSYASHRDADEGNSIVPLQCNKQSENN